MQTRNKRILSVVALLGTLLAAGSAAAVVGSVSLWTPWKYTSTKVRGKAYVYGDCSNYVTCAFHTSLERSSWSGYRTVSDTKINKTSGYQYPTGYMLNGTYTYKTHFHGDFTFFAHCGADGICIKQSIWRSDSSGARLTR